MTQNRLAQLARPQKVKPVVDKVVEQEPTEDTPVQTEEQSAEVDAVKAFEYTKAKPSAEQIARRNRRVRSPIDGRRNILTVKGLASGMVGRWVDNTPERVEQLLEQGYEPVRDVVQVGDTSIDSGKSFGATVTKRVGSGKEQILMQIPEEWWIADQKRKQKIVDEKETAIRGIGKQAGLYGGVTLADVVPGKRPTSRKATDEE